MRALVDAAVVVDGADVRDAGVGVDQQHNRCAASPRSAHRRRRQRVGVVVRRQRWTSGAQDQPTPTTNVNICYRRQRRTSQQTRRCDKICHITRTNTRKKSNATRYCLENKVQFDKLRLCAFDFLDLLTTRERERESRTATFTNCDFALPQAAKQAHIRHDGANAARLGIEKQNQIRPDRSQWRTVNALALNVGFEPGTLRCGTESDR